MEYPVPQFIEIESKIIGPLTLKQFIYIAGGGGLCIILFHFLPFFLAVLACLPVAGFAGALAFYKINNKPFIATVEAAFRFYTSSRLFLWHKEHTKESAVQAAPAAAPAAHAASRLTRGKLHELAWSLDIQNHPRERSSL
ncbi:MAG: hypothetical protein B7X04_02670 [Parcubacteria group bacterium 21-54-25]|nr:MAG: hypothetical protein B7X04_02670 [Parcubacteria group bacterium 21-54-25]HQU07744.1 PrgI family protein [Candidatus Paceibacterota bacterium]